MIPGSASTGTNTRRRRSPGRGHHGRGQSGVAATGDRQVAAVLAAREPETFGHLEVEEHAHQVPPLVRAGDVAGLVLDPHPAVPVNPSRRGELRRCRANGVAAKPWPSTAATAASRRSTRPTKVSVRHPARHGAVIAVEQAPVRARTARSSAVRAGNSTDAVEDPLQNVVDVPLVRGSGSGTGRVRGESATRHNRRRPGGWQAPSRQR